MTGDIDELLERVYAQARVNHPERFAPDGEPLAGYVGRGWDERLESWRRAHPEFQEPTDPQDQDAPFERVRLHLLRSN